MPELAQPEFLTGKPERRRNPRYRCGGDVRIICLPSDGSILGGQLGNLGRGGCYIETVSPFELGARTEILLRVNRLSFRALGQVRALHAGGGIGVEFLRLTAAGSGILADLLVELQRLQALRKVIKTSTPEERRELLQLYPDNRWANAGVLDRNLTIVGSVLPVHGDDNHSVLRREISCEDLQLSGSLLDLFI